MDKKSLTKVKDPRYLFHSETDFQFALSRQLCNSFSNLNTRFEKEMVENNYAKSIDIWARYNEYCYGFELKYIKQFLSKKVIGSNTKNKPILKNKEKKFHIILM